MPKVTIIAADGLVGVDGVFRKVNLDNLASNIHAVQWDGTEGYIELKDKSQKPISSLGQFLSVLDRWDLAAPPADPTPTTEETAEKEVAALRILAVEEFENARIEAALETEAARVGGNAKVKAYIRAKGELAALKNNGK